MHHMPWRASQPLRRLSENTSAAYYQSSIALRLRQRLTVFDQTPHGISLQRERLVAWVGGSLAASEVLLTQRDVKSDRSAAHLT